MAQPTKVVEVDFANGPGAALSAATWTDVSAYVRSISVSRGKRQDQEDHFAQGSATLVLDNRDGRFDPNNTASPYAPDVLPMRRVRIRSTEPGGTTYDDATATYDDASVAYEGDIHDVFVGYIREWPQAWRGPNDAYVTVQAVDAFVILNNRALPDSVYAYEVAQDQPDHWWHLGEASGTVAVDSGFADRLVNGIYAGSPTLAASSLVEHDSNTAIEFDGSDDTMTAVDGIQTSGFPYTIEFLLNVGALPVSDDALIVGEAGEFAIRLTSAGKLLCHSTLDVLDAGLFDTGAFTLSTGTTYHVAVVFTSGAEKLYVDGTDRADAGALGKVYQDVQPGGLHVSGDGVYARLNGTLDELAIYGSELSPTRVGLHVSAVDAPWNGDTSGTRAGRALDIAGWPTADRDVDAGQTTFGDGNFSDDENVLSYLNRCADSESGHLFVNKSGQVRFIERLAFITETTYNTSQATFADADSAGVGEFEYHDLALDAFGVDDIYNAVTVQRKFGVSQTVEDATSQSSYLTRSLSKTALLMDTDAEARSAAEYLLAKFKDPRTKVSQMVLTPGADNAAWAQVLGRELMDRVTVQRDPPGAGDTLSQEVHIIGIQHEIGPKSWTTTMWLSPADTDQYWVLGDSELSVLGSTTRVAY